MELDLDVRAQRPEAVRRLEGRPLHVELLEEGLLDLLQQALPQQLRLLHGAVLTGREAVEWLAEPD